MFFLPLVFPDNTSLWFGTPNSVFVSMLEHFENIGQVFGEKSDDFLVIPF
jgi:hypothetical protein